MLKLVNVSEGEQVRLFNNIAIEIASRCNRHCFFCPNGYFDRVDEYMETKLVIKALEDLKALNYKGRLEWYIYNEPTRDERLIDFVAMARLLLPHACQMINTNGDYFKTQDDIGALFAAGLNQMQINIYSAADGDEDEQKFSNGVRLAKKREAVLQTWVDGLKLDQKISLYQNIGSKKQACQVVAKYGIRKTIKDTELDGVNHFSNRSGNIPGFRGVVGDPLPKHCTRPFRFLNINWNGDAILCCNDYYGETNFGNIKTHTLTEIWNHPNFNLYRLKLQNKKRDCFLCHNCDFVGGFYPHMIDNVTFGEEIDSVVLQSNLSKRGDIFDAPIALPIKKQGAAKQF